MGTGDSVTDRGLRAAADDDDLFFELHRQDDVESYGCPRAERQVATHILLEACQRERHVVRARRESAECERAGAVGEGVRGRTVGLRAARLHGDAGQHEPRGVGDGAFDDWFLCVDEPRRRESRQQCEEDHATKKPGSRFVPRDARRRREWPT